MFLKKKNNEKHTRGKLYLRHALLVMLFIPMLFASHVKPASAKFCIDCDDWACPIQAHISQLWSHIIAEHAKTLAAFAFELLQHELWFSFFYFSNVEPVLSGVAHQMTNVIMDQTLMIGAMIDANHQLETQRLLQRLTAQAHKDYHPSYGMCTFGTAVRSLASVDSRASITRSVLEERSIKRQLASAGVSGADMVTDRNARLTQFKERFCDRFDNNRVDNKPTTGLELVCEAAIPANTLARDVDFHRTVMQNRTIDFDVLDASVNTEDPEIFALANNLYAHNSIKNIPPDLLGNKENHKLYMELRSIVAKRSVAENSFNSIVSMKAVGSPDGAFVGSAGTEEYMNALLVELGMEEDDATAFLGERPGYLAQLEVLAKKIYQQQSFYVDLYDKPANVKRKKVAMQAIGLMLDRDIYNSQIRSESMMSMLLELKVARAQDAVENNIGSLEKK